MLHTLVPHAFQFIYGINVLAHMHKNGTHKTKALVYYRGHTPGTHLSDEVITFHHAGKKKKKDHKKVENILKMK